MKYVQTNGAGCVVVIMDSVVAWNGWLNIVLYFIVALNFNSKLGVAKTSSAVLRCLAVRFSLFTSQFLDQFLSVSPRLVGPYSGGGGFQVLWSKAKI